MIIRLNVKPAELGGRWQWLEGAYSCTQFLLVLCLVKKFLNMYSSHQSPTAGRGLVITIIAETQRQRTMKFGATPWTPEQDGTTAPSQLVVS